MMYLQCVFCCFLVLCLFLRAMTIMMVTIPTINTTTRAPTAPRMPPSRKGEGLLVGVTVVGSVTALEDTDAWTVPPAMVVVDITAVIDVEETAGLITNVRDRDSMYDGEYYTLYRIAGNIGSLYIWQFCPKPSIRTYWYWQNLTLAVAPCIVLQSP